jgi:hypothetical protein
MNYETFVEAPKTDSDSEQEIQELTLDELHYVAGGAGTVRVIEGFSSEALPALPA